jgi:hypothetical protein
VQLQEPVFFIGQDCKNLFREYRGLNNDHSQLYANGVLYATSICCNSVRYLHAGGRSHLCLVSQVLPVLYDQ